MSAPTEEIKAKVDVVELIGEYVKLTQAGTNWKGRCPFHAEKTPSFMASRDKQIWHCFGCHEGGDIFTFLQKIEGIEFPEALRILGQRAGVEIRREDQALSNLRTRMMDLNVLAARYYAEVLQRSTLATKAREYIKRRGIDDVTIQAWQIGFAPESWDATSNFLKGKGYTEPEIFSAGLSLQRERRDGFYDRFRDRLMFPVCDHHGHVVGFSGRTLDPEAKEAKYLNTPQTPLYNKGQVLLGLDKAKEHIRREKTSVVVEGNLDVISSHKAGVKNVVAPCGTALTPEHCLLLKRYAPTVVLCFDRDTAGVHAAQRSISIALAAGLDVKLVNLPEGHDPDSFIRERGAAAWQTVIAQSLPVMDYYFQTVVDPANVADPKVKKGIVTQLLPVIADMASPVEQSHWLQKLADRLSVPESVLQEAFIAIKHQKFTNAPASPRVVAAEALDPAEQQGRQLLMLLFAHPTLIPTVIDQLTPEMFTGVLNQHLYTELVLYYTAQHTRPLGLDWINDFVTALPGEPAGYATQLSMLGSQERERLPFQSAMADVAMLVRDIKRNSLKMLLAQLNIRLKQAEASGDTTTLHDISAQFSRLTDQLNTLR